MLDDGAWDSAICFVVYAAASHSLGSASLDSASLDSDARLGSDDEDRASQCIMPHRRCVSRTYT